MGEDRFFKIVDLAVMEIDHDKTTVFTRVSGHPPCSLDETHNTPFGSGPFKQILYGELKDVSQNKTYLLEIEE